MQASTDHAAYVADPHQHQPPPPATRRSPQRAAPRHGEGGQRRRRTAALRHTAGGGPCPPPPPPRPAAPAPHATLPRQQQQDGGRVLSSATGPSTARCSKDVTTHQHRPGARPGRPWPVPACSGQPLPGERRFSSPLGTELRRRNICLQQQGRHLEVKVGRDEEGVNSLRPELAALAPTLHVPGPCNCPCFLALWLSHFASCH